MKKIAFWGSVIALTVWTLAIIVMGVSLLGDIDTEVIKVCSYVMIGCLVVLAPCSGYRVWLKQQEYEELKETVRQLKENRK
ncbi:hypothetical protein INF35_00205 [Subdoligranulum sp. DSM 109015]|uniref:Uncharacterized protein n=1 Tax=Gemmiger gallinarum TaxID=2779354 RepID=A0ABR9QZC9_9FIRM|nr:hypothetical protein [Gemmiger gallinarum]MBE5036229.1 hypothetical protein [Gemmiger gallinarum]